jgi:hypothetical protein
VKVRTTDPVGCRTWRTLILLLLVRLAVAQNAPVLLWPSGAPGSEGKTGDEIVRSNEHGERIVSNVHHPSITLYLPSKDKATGAAVIIAPGGGHRDPTSEPRRRSRGSEPPVPMDGLWQNSIQTLLVRHTRLGIGACKR